MMKTRWPSTTLLCWLISLLVVAQLACNLPLLVQPTDTPVPPAATPVPPTATPVPPTATPVPPTETPVPTASPEPVLLDLCSLITAEEAEEILGGTVEAQSDQGTGGCTYLLQSDDPYVVKQLSVGAAQGEEAKMSMAIGVFIAAGLSQNEELSTIAETLNEDPATMSLQEVLTLVVQGLELVGFEVTPEPGLGEDAHWLWWEDISPIGEVMVVQGDNYVWLMLQGLEQDAAHELAAALVERVLGALPPTFRVLEMPESEAAD